MNSIKPFIALTAANPTHFQTPVIEGVRKRTKFHVQLYSTCFISPLSKSEARTSNTVKVASFLKKGKKIQNHPKRCGITNATARRISNPHLN